MNIWKHIKLLIDGSCTTNQFNELFSFGLMLGDKLTNTNAGQLITSGKDDHDALNIIG